MIIDVLGGILLNKVFYDINKPKSHESKKNIYEKNLFYSDRAAWEKRRNMQHLKGCMKTFYCGNGGEDFWWTYDQICLIVDRLKEQKFPFTLEYYSFKEHRRNIIFEGSTLDDAELFMSAYPSILIQGYLCSDEGKVLKEIDSFVCKFPDNLRLLWRQGKIIIDNIEMTLSEADRHISEEWERMNEKS